MGRKCAVPHCYTGYRKCKEKASLYRVPDDDFFLNKWQEAIAREDRPITPKDYVCEKHFKEDDILRRRIIKDVMEEYQRPKLKPDAIPSIFPDLPEFILKMVKKRKKIPAEDTLFTAINHSLANNKEPNNVEENETKMDIKIEPIETDETNNLASTVCESILNNEIHIKSEEPDSKESEEDANYFDYGPKMHQCDQCEYTTKYYHNLRTHKTKHLTGDAAYIYCELCPNFKTKWELTYRNHLKIKHCVGRQETFKCNVCNFKTKVKLCLKRHVKRHQKSFICDVFGCNFKDEDNEALTAHKLSHNLNEAMEKETYHSKYSFKTKSQDTQDSLECKKLQSKVWKCLKCPYVTIFQHAFKRHQSSCGELFSCQECHFKSKIKSECVRHSLTHRNISVNVVQKGCASENMENCHREVDQIEIIFNSRNCDGNDSSVCLPEFIAVKQDIVDDS